MTKPLSAELVQKVLATYWAMRGTGTPHSDALVDQVAAECGVTPPTVRKYLKREAQTKLAPASPQNIAGRWYKNEELVAQALSDAKRYCTSKALELYSKLETASEDASSKEIANCTREQLQILKFLAELAGIGKTVDINVNKKEESFHTIITAIQEVAQQEGEERERKVIECTVT